MQELLAVKDLAKSCFASLKFPQTPSDSFRRNPTNKSLLAFCKSTKDPQPKAIRSKPCIEAAWDSDPFIQFQNPERKTKPGTFFCALQTGHVDGVLRSLLKPFDFRCVHNPLAYSLPVSKSPNSNRTGTALAKSLLRSKEHKRL